MVIIMIVSGAVVVLVCAVFLAYEYLSFRRASEQQIATLGRIVAANSTAALAFDNQKDAREILSALREEPQIVAGILYDAHWKPFATYPTNLPPTALPSGPGGHDYRWVKGYLVGYQPVIQAESRPLGALYLKADMSAMRERLLLYLEVASGVVGVAFLAAYLLSRTLQRHVSAPILSLAAAARVVSDRRDYSIRAPALGDDELGKLTLAFNQMLNQIEEHIDERHRSEAAILAKNRELESLLYVISHDLREPLRVTRNFAELLREDYGATLDKKGRHLLTRIGVAGERMERLLLDLLDISRIRRLTPPGTRVDSRALVNTALERLAAKIRETGAQVGVAADLPELVADPTWTVEAVYNLLSNALKHCRPGETPVIEVAGHQRATGPRAGVGLVVRDRGPGVPEGQRERIFELFQRGVGREIEGTGAGLAIVREVAARHGGEAWMEPREGGGSQFYITFSPARTTENNPNT